MSYSLDNTQWIGAHFLAERRVAYLCDGVGLGKTPQFIVACDIVGARSITVVCPPSLAVKTCREFERWQLFPRTIAIVEQGAGRLPTADVLVVPYSLLTQDRVRAKVRERAADVVIFDEAHALKSPGSKRTLHAVGKAGVIRHAKRVWWTSGTAAPNFAHEYYTFARCAGIWTDDYETFARKFCVVADDQYGWKVVDDKAATREELRQLLAPYILERHGRATGAQLYVSEVAVTAAPPDLSSVDPTAIERIHAALAADDLSSLNDDMIATARRLIGTAKAGACAAHVLADYGGARSLVFCLHTDVINIMASAIGDACAGIIDGRTSARERLRLLDAFSAGVGPPILIAHLASASEGLNLQAATRVYLVEPAWTPATNEQAIARAYRRGQERDVYAQYLYLRGTLDEAVCAKLARKDSAREARKQLMSSKIS